MHFFTSVKMHALFSHTCSYIKGKVMKNCVAAIGAVHFSGVWLTISATHLFKIRKTKEVGGAFSLKMCMARPFLKGEINYVL